MPRHLPLALAVLALASCTPATPVVKVSSLDPEVLAARPLPANHLSAPDEQGERQLDPDGEWLCSADPGDGLRFAGLPGPTGAPRFALVLGCDAGTQTLVLHPLGSGESPLDAAGSPSRLQELRRLADGFASRQGATDRTTELLRLDFRHIQEQGGLGLPVPPPRRIFGVAANFPSHLADDLALDPHSAADALRRSRPRVFLKYPAVAPPGRGFQEEASPGVLLGHLGTVRPPPHVDLPDTDPSAGPAEPRIDYEVEIGLVLARDLTWKEVGTMADADLRAAVAGYVLLGDTKARNPQVVGKIAAFDRPLPAGSEPYRVGDEDLDEALGPWDSSTCQWWSYAASWGAYASVGPFFVAAEAAEQVPARAVVAARAYAPAAVRGAPLPPGRVPGAFYLRQAGRVTENPEYADRMIWDLPAILRSILAPGSALSFLEGGPRLQRGDIVSLGTPGGTVITAVPHRLADIAEDLVFWRSPRDWHDTLFRRTGHLYLRAGDEVFYWASGLGYQRLTLGPAR